MKHPTHQIVDYFFELKGWDDMEKEFYENNNIVYGRFVRPARDLICLCDNSVDKAKNMLIRMKEWAEERGLDWTIETIFKRWFDINN